MTQNEINEINKLKYMAQELNPFSSEISEELKQILDEFGLIEFIDDPFRLSNEILKRLHSFDTVTNDSKTLQ